MNTFAEKLKNAYLGSKNALPDFQHNKNFHKKVGFVTFMYLLKL